MRIKRKKTYTIIVNKANVTFTDYEATETVTITNFAQLGEVQVNTDNGLIVQTAYDAETGIITLTSKGIGTTNVTIFAANAEPDSLEIPVTVTADLNKFITTEQLNLGELATDGAAKAAAQEIIDNNPDLVGKVTLGNPNTLKINVTPNEGSYLTGTANFVYTLPEGLKAKAKK